MKNKLIALLVVVLIHLPSITAQVKFNKATSFEEMLAIAQAADKDIFIDVYTDWCGPCKMMDANVFSTQTVGDYMNTNFVAFKFEAEKDSLGQLLAMKFGVNGYPSFLVLKSDGSLRFHFLGYSDAKIWLANLKEQQQQTPEKLAGISKELVLDWPEIYTKAYVAENGRRTFPKAPEVAEFLQDKDWLDEIPFRIVQRFQFALEDEFQENVIASKQEVIDRYGSAVFDAFVYRYYSGKASNALKSGNEKLLLAAIQDYEKQFPDDTSFRRQQLANFYFEYNDFQKFADLFEGYLPTITAGEINHFSWRLYENCEEQEPLLAATNWMKAVVASNRSYMYYDTYAALLYKTKAYDLATKWANKAIVLGNQEREDVSETEVLLEKIKAAQKE